MKFLVFAKQIIQKYSFMGVIHRTLGDKGYILLLCIAVGVISGSRNIASVSGVEDWTSEFQRQRRLE